MSKLFIAISLLISFFSASLLAQTIPDPTPSPRTKRVNLYGDLLGSIELPEDFSGYLTADYMDAWAGSLISKISGFEIHWRAGTIVYVLDDRKNDIESYQKERVGDILIERASLRGKEGKTLVTKIGWLEFSALIRDPGDEKIFAVLTDSYRKEKCKTCVSLPRRSKN